MARADRDAARVARVGGWGLVGVLAGLAGLLVGAMLGKVKGE